MSLASGYSPKFEGIYILTPSGVQTRLFDYVEPLQGDETVNTVDIDRDGDSDYLYLMDGILYLKSSHAKEPSRQKDTTLTITDLDPANVPEAPNFFHEVVASPGQLELDFSRAQSRDRAFRLEFFDHYTEWDLLHLDAHDEQSIPRTVMDLVSSDDSHDIDVGGISVHPLSRVLERVSGTLGFQIVGPRVTPLTLGKPFTLTQGRPLYTGKTQSRLTYTTLSGSTPEYLTLKPYSRYSFDTSLSGSLTSGVIYFMDTSTAEKTLYSDDLLGMPILDGMTLSNLEGSFDIRDPLGSKQAHIES